nr:retrovirus-related Pol polyprotein from transposon TNT 1-94 [Tanacetum cinerariifolium]
AEITRKKINAKMNDPECVTRKVKIAPYDYSKENFLAIFTPQKQLTPEQIFWSNDLMKLKSEALKERDQDRKHDAIERKNLLIANDNLIAECLSQEVFSVATNSELNVARFTEMHVANTTIEARCLALEVELANLCDKNNHDNQKELINHFSKLKHYKELYDSIKIIRAKHIEKVTNLTTKNVNLQASVSKDQVKPRVLAREKYAIDVEPIVPCLRNNRDVYLDYLRHHKESVETIYNIIEEAKVTNVPVPPSTGVNSCPNASGSQPKSHVKPYRILPAKGVNKLPIEDQPRKNKSHLRTSNRVDSSSRLKHTVINSNSDSICQ